MKHIITAFIAVVGLQGMVAAAEPEPTAEHAALYAEQAKLRKQLANSTGTNARFMGFRWNRINIPHGHITKVTKEDTPEVKSIDYFKELITAGHGWLEHCHKLEVAHEAPRYSCSGFTFKETDDDSRKQFIMGIKFNELASEYDDSLATVALNK